ncbi:MAG: 50S ribosomal protein L21 [Nitrospinota bacterium]|nr:MAG: 50S ribosomal protein L21 [Nitrospinota bacterium]
MTESATATYAVIKTGGKQYRVSPGDIITVERLPGEKGDAVTLSDVLLWRDGEEVHIGTPFLSEVRVTGKILRQYRGKKVIIFKHRRRKNSRKKQGHRQEYTLLQIVDITRQPAGSQD